MKSLMKIKELLFKPRIFFEKLSKVCNYKTTAIYLLIISIIWYLLQFLGTIISIHNPHIFSRGIGSDILFSSLNFLAIKSFFILLIAIIVVIFVFSIVLSLVLKLLFMIPKVKISVGKIWIITVYSLTPFIVYEIIKLISLHPVLSFLEYTVYLFYLYSLILILIGVSAFAKVSKRKFRLLLSFVVILMILVAVLFTINEIRESNEFDFETFSAKIGDVLVFGKENVIAVCKTPKCIELPSYCYESSGNEWNCKYAFDVTLNSVASNKFVKITNNLKTVEEYENEYLEEPLSFYLDGEKIGEVMLSPELKGREITQVSIIGTSKGETKYKATNNALSDMRKLQLFLDPDS